MYYYNGSIHIEEEDQCITCQNFNEGIACPLLQALALGMVKLEDSLCVTNCGFYKEFIRHLKIVSVSEEEEEKAKEESSSKKNKVRNINSLKNE